MYRGDDSGAAATIKGYTLYDFTTNNILVARYNRNTPLVVGDYTVNAAQSGYPTFVCPYNGTIYYTSVLKSSESSTFTTVSYTANSSWTFPSGYRTTLMAFKAD